MSVDAPDVSIDEKGHVVVTLPSDATGTVTITVDGKKYTAEVKNGKAEFDIPELSAGKHDISISYSGDDKYSPVITDAAIKVVDKKHNNETKHESQSHAGKSVSEGVDLSNQATGNPIMVLLLMLLAIGSATLRRFKK